MFPQVGGEKLGSRLCQSHPLEAGKENEVDDWVGSQKQTTSERRIKERSLGASYN